MLSNLLIVYEIAEKASRVTSRRRYLEFERWAKQIIESYKDAAVERLLRSHMFRLKSQFAF